MVHTETNVRLTDVLGDKVLSRLGNTGNELLADLFGLLNQALGVPFEVTPMSPASAQVTVQSGIYTLPDGRRMASFKGGMLPALSSAVVDFGAGTISSGTNPTFALPTLNAGDYVRALIQYSFAKNSLNVAFGTNASSLAATTVPSVLVDFIPVAIVELHSTNGGAGVFDAVQATNIVAILDGADFVPSPIEEVQTVVGSQKTLFTLSSISIPSARSRLQIFKNGIRQLVGTHFQVTTDTTVTFIDPVAVDAEVCFRVQ